MSDMNIMTNFSNNTKNALVPVNTSQHTEAISENIWIIGVSKTHPGLKYYFNTVTGVSLWNISREDMDRAKHTMKSHQNQSLYINCPEPEEPPPNKRMSTNKSVNCKKQCLNSGLADTPGFTCDVCFDTENSSTNLITVNFRSSYATCNSQSDNACRTHSQIQSASTFLDSSMLEKDYCNVGHLLESQRALNRTRSIAETAVQDSHNERLTNQSNIDEFHNRNTNHFGTLDLTQLKMFAKNGVVKDKWYIIADADVYLQHFTLLKSVVYSDNQCCLMVPKNVKMLLEKATKTELRTKAHCAIYFIYKMFDLGLALIDDDSSNCIQDKTNEEHILESCSKLREQNFYVVVISNDIDLQKYRNKVYIPIFTVGELKEYLYKNDNSETANSPEPTFNISQSTNTKVVTKNNLCKKLADIHESIITNSENCNKNNQNSLILNDMGTQVEGLSDVSKTGDAEVQTDFHPKQMEKIANANMKTDWPNQNDDINRRMKLSKSNSNLCESSLPNSNSGSRKRLKLRRPKIFNETAPNLSTKIVDRSENDISNTLNILPSDNNLLNNKNLEEQSKNSNKILKPNQTTTLNTLKQNIDENYHTANSPEPTFNLSQSTNANVVTQNILCNKLADIHESIITNPEKCNKKIRNSVICNDMGTQVEGLCDVSKTADAEVQTDFHPKQMETIANANMKTDWPNQNDDVNRRMKLSKSNNNLCESSLHNSNLGSRKSLKLKRPKMFKETAPNLSTNIVRSEMDISSTLNILPINNNLLLHKNVEVQSKNSNKNLKPHKTTTSNTLKHKIDESNEIPKKPLKSVQSTNLESNSYKDNIEIKNVMFEITTDTMDGNLRTKSDEFVSRFVQIMEEALTQVLRKNSTLHLPPPWNMYEAAICIEKKFHNDEDVQDSSKKFLNILNRICDKKGNINCNISPSEYMEMYSFGVYMIDALQGIFSKCEDLQSAAESLSKLLNDIQDPETDMTNIESLHQSTEEHLNNDTDNNDNTEVFMIVETASHSNENSTDFFPIVSESVASKNVLSCNNSEGSKKFDQFKITFTNTEFSKNCNANEEHTTKNSSLRAIRHIERNYESQEDSKTIFTKTQNPCNTPETSPNKYNLRSKRRTMPSEKTDAENLSNDDPFKSSFFSNLSLQTNVSNPYNCEENFGKNITTEDVTDNVDSSGYTKSNVGCSYQFDSRPSGLAQEITISNEPKVVRNFVICSKFENRLNKRRTHDKMEELDFEEEMMEANYLDEDVSLDCSGKHVVDEFPEYHDSVDGYHMDHEIKKSSEYVEVNFKYFLRRIAEEIKELSSEVYTFGQNSSEVLRSLSTSQDKKCIQERVEQALLYLNKISMVLTNILKRDTNGGNNVQALLEHTEFSNILVDEDQLEAYGTFITSCLEHANDLKNTLVYVLSAISSF